MESPEKVYVVTSGEFTCDDRSSFLVRGVFRNRHDAVDLMERLCEESLSEFKDEFVAHRYPNQILIHSKNDGAYEYDIEISSHEMNKGE